MSTRNAEFSPVSLCIHECPISHANRCPCGHFPISEAERKGCIGSCMSPATPNIFTTWSLTEHVCITGVRVSMSLSSAHSPLSCLALAPVWLADPGPREEIWGKPSHQGLWLPRGRCSRAPATRQPRGWGAIPTAFVSAVSQTPTWSRPLGRPRARVPVNRPLKISLMDTEWGGGGQGGGECPGRKPGDKREK